MKHCDVKCREGRSIFSVWYKKGRTEQWWENLLIDKLPEEDWEKIKHLTRDIPYLIQDNQTFFQHISMTV